MKEEVIVRPVEGNDMKQLAEWLDGNKDKNALDPEIFNYPSLEVVKAVKGDKVLSYLPFHHVIVLESVAPNPTATSLELAEALAQMVRIIIFAGWKGGVREIYFLGSDDKVNGLASRHGFERIGGAIYGLKMR